jgi:hypothetical protein
MSNLIYLASPYTHPEPAVREARFRAVCRAAARLMRGGQHIFSPIAASHPLTAYGLPGHWEYWEAYDTAMIGACGGLIVYTLPGWEESKGVGAEIRIAQRRGLEPSYLGPTAEELAELAGA